MCAYNEVLKLMQTVLLEAFNLANAKGAGLQFIDLFLGASEFVTCRPNLCV